MFGPRLDHEEGVPRGFDDSLQRVQLMSVDQCENMREIDDSQLVGAPVIAGDAEVLARQEVPVQVMSGLEAVRSAATGNSGERMRKPIRGRPPRSQRTSTPAQPYPRRRRDEEDVCFICFDGGSLVLCDRRGCPKAYHPVCIKRDESFFRSRAKWNCGWHICSSCQKASHYMCYTCTFSLCKVCTKDADYFCVRGNKGFCGTCMQTVMLIENMPIGNKEVVQVDFDDKGSWEYLFKVYWIDLKQKLSLTLEELTKAKNPWKAVVGLPPKVESPGGFCNNNDEKVRSLDNSSRNLEANSSKRRKTRNQPYLSTAHNKSRKTTFYVDNKDGTTLIHEPVHASTCNQGGESFGSKKWNLPKNQVGFANSMTSTWNNQAALQSESQPQGASKSSLAPCSTVTELSIHNFETERLWHYHDRAGNIQGPFSMLQLRKWSTNGYFPSDLRVWRIKEKQEGSILLSDALDGRHSEVPVLICKSLLLPVDVRVPSDGVHKIMDAQRSASSDASWVDNKMVEVTWNSMQNDTSIHKNNDNESARSTKLGSHSSSWTRHAHPVICNQQTEGSLKASDLSKDPEYGADQPQSRTSLPSPTPPVEELRLTPSLQGTEGCEDEKWTDSQSGITINPPKTTGSRSRITDGDWKREDSESYSGQASSEQCLGPAPINSSSNGWEGSGMVSLTMSIERSQHKREIHFPDLLSRGPKHSESGLECQATENKQSMSLSVPVLDSGSSWSATSGLFGGGLQLPEVPGDAFVSSPTQTKPSVDEWDSNIVSSSSLRPFEVASDYAASPTSGCGQQTHSSAVHLADGSSWQAFVPEPTEFCSLPDESVSDLLAEVEAMEALGRLGSPTSSISWWGIQGIRTRH